MFSRSSYSDCCMILLSMTIIICMILTDECRFAHYSASRWQFCCNCIALVQKIGLDSLFINRREKPKKMLLKVILSILFVSVLYPATHSSSVCGKLSPGYCKRMENCCPRYSAMRYGCKYRNAIIEVWLFYNVLFLYYSVFLSCLCMPFL